MILSPVCIDIRVKTWSLALRDGSLRERGRNKRLEKMKMLIIYILRQILKI
jgi:hypothetical protein